MAGFSDISIDVEQRFKEKIANDDKIKSILNKIDNSKASMNDMSEYSRQLGHLARQSIYEIYKEQFDERPKWSDVQNTVKTLLSWNYDNINELESKVQKSIDSTSGLHLNPIEAEYPSERIDTVIGAAANAETLDQAIRRMGSPVENITASFHSDYIEKNAEFRNKAGLTCYIERKDGHNCCKWCAGLAGRYRYPDEVPKDVYRRHDNCTCDVSYVSEKGRQNVHSKKWTNEQAKAQRIEYAANVRKPMKLTKEQAKELERKQLTKASDSVIIRLKDTDTLFHAVSDKAIRSVPLISVFGDKGKDEAHKKASQELLKVAKSVNKPVGTEIAATYSSDMKRIIGMNIGNVGSVSMPPSDKPFHAFHNHGSDETFSFTDLLNFSMNNNMLSLTAQGNQGSKYVIVSSVNSDKEGCYLFLKAISHETIFSADGVNFTLDSIYGDNRAETQAFIQKMSEDDFGKLKKAVTSKTDDCLKGVEDFDIKYFKAKVAD